MNKRYFEIYVSGHNGYSAYVSTIKPLTILKGGTDIAITILELAIAAKVIEGGDAKEIYCGAGYIVEHQLAELPPDLNFSQITEI